MEFVNWDLGFICYLSFEFWDLGCEVIPQRNTEKHKGTRRVSGFWFQIRSSEGQNNLLTTIGFLISFILNLRFFSKLCDEAERTKGLSGEYSELENRPSSISI